MLQTSNMDAPILSKFAKKRCQYDVAAMDKAIRAVRGGFTLADAAAKFKVPKSTLGKHYKKSGTVLGGGRKQEICEEDEAHIAKYILECSRFGMGLTKTETLDIVKEFVIDRQLITRFGADGPKKDWLKNFLFRHPEISLRKGELLSGLRAKAPDPFIIEKWYRQLSAIYKRESIRSYDGKYVYNCDETGFQHDPQNIKVFASKGQRRVSRNTAGSGKNSTTVLACGSASGHIMPPLIVFKGKYMMSNWIPEPGEDFPGTGYTAQSRGWMEGTLFAHWFKTIFLANVEPWGERTKKIVLICDGAASHLTYALSKLAVDNGVILVKLPPNLTHYMQPLDKCVFGPIKQYWNKLMLVYNKDNPVTPLSKSNFAIKIKQVWETAFTSKNMTSGFASTGLFPIDFERVPEEAYRTDRLLGFKTFKAQQSSSTIVTTDADVTNNSLEDSHLPASPNASSINPEPVPSTSIQSLQTLIPSNTAIQSTEQAPSTFAQRFQISSPSRSLPTSPNASSINAEPVPSTSKQSLQTLTPLNTAIQSTELAPATSKRNFDHSSTTSIQTQGCSRSKEKSALEQIIIEPSSSCAGTLSSSTSSSRNQNLSFEEFIRNKLSEKLVTRTADNNNSDKRCRVTNVIGDIVTSARAMDALKEREETKKKTQAAKERKVREQLNGKTNKKRKQTVKLDKTSNDNNSVSDNETIRLPKKPPNKKTKKHDSGREETSSEGEQTTDISYASETETEEFDSDPEEVSNRSMGLTLKHFYAVYYDDRWYIGRVINFRDKNHTKFKFLHFHLDKLQWPTHDDIQVIDNKFVFYGPIKLQDSEPFNLTRHEKVTIESQFKKMKQELIF